MYSPVALTVFSLLTSITSVQAVVAWTVNCGVLAVQRSDPIISPGVASSHVHAISGGTAFARTMIGDNVAVDAAATTCDKFTDHSNYVGRYSSSKAHSLIIRSGHHNYTTSEMMACLKWFRIQVSTATTRTTPAITTPPKSIAR